MLTHDQIIHAIEQEHGVKHGRDFFVGHPVDGRGVQTGEPFIVEWRHADIPQPDIEAVTALYHEKYASKFIATGARNQRDYLLRQSDWTQLGDVPEATREKYREYRQALRDVPKQAGFPAKIDWPDLPD